MNKTVTLFLLCTVLLCIACEQEEGKFKDPRDKKIYKTVKIGEQVWMAENLNYEAKGSGCYGEGGTVWNGKEDVTLPNTEIQANCNKYGRLYIWETAIKACPSGWHLPSHTEWDALLRYADGTSGTGSPYKSETAGKFLKATSGWGDGNGEDKFGFSALPGGYGTGYYFYSIRTGGIWWSANENDSYKYNAYVKYMSDKKEQIETGDQYKGLMYSVRCVKDRLCGSQIFNTTTQFCDNNTIYDLCEGQIYTPANQRCSAINIVETKCGTGWFDAINVNQRCENGVAETKCGTRWYNYDSMQYCFKGTMKYYSALTDARDNKTYKTVKIGKQVWMAENLNYEADSSECYKNSTAYCDKYGRLYEWETAMKVCPKFWHLPSVDEWHELAKAVGGIDTASKYLKATGGWNHAGKSGNGTDDYGFSALPGGQGIHHPYGGFDYAGEEGFWWSTEELNEHKAYARIMGFEESVGFLPNYTNYLYSVRCIQNTPAPPKGETK